VAAAAAAAVLTALAGCARVQPAPGSGNGFEPAPSATPRASAAPSRPPSPGVSAPAAPDRCPRLAVDGQDAAMGLRVIGIRLTNCGPKALRLNGYPVVRALDAQGKPLDIRTLDGLTPITGSIPDTLTPPAPIVVPPGGHAAFALAWRNTYDDIRRPPVNAPLISVATAKGQPATVVTLETGLDLGSTGRLAVGPWRPDPAPSATPTR
jgi:hypothetical protein